MVAYKANAQINANFKTPTKARGDPAENKLISNVEQEIDRCWNYAAGRSEKSSLKGTATSINGDWGQYNKYKNELQQVAQKIGELESEVEEHK